MVYEVATFDGQGYLQGKGPITREEAIRLQGANIVAILERWANKPGNNQTATHYIGEHKWLEVSKGE